MNPQAVLQERYPTADFSVYFRFLEACAGTQRDSGRTHGHHICPRKQFPDLEDEPDNVITLHIDDHALAHKLLGAAVPELSRATAAWIESQKDGAAKGGRVAARVHKKNRTGPYAPGSRKLGRVNGRKNALRLKEHGRGWFAPGVAAMGGRITGRKTKELGIGVHAPGMAAKGGRSLTLEQHREFGSIGARVVNHKRWHVSRGIKSPTCALCQEK
jgi:hypothetical protein